MTTVNLQRNVTMFHPPNSNAGNVNGVTAAMTWFAEADVRLVCTMFGVAP